VFLIRMGDLTTTVETYELETLAVSQTGEESKDPERKYS
jgi:hypothetical protein